MFLGTAGIIKIRQVHVSNDEIEIGKDRKEVENKLQAHTEPDADVASPGCDIHCYSTSDVCWDKYWAGLFISETKGTKERKTKSNRNCSPIL